MKRMRQLVFAVMLVISGAFGTAMAAQDALPVTILPPEDDYDGVSMAEWDARSWQYQISFPNDINPSFDSTGENCNMGQSGPVFYIPSIFGGLGPGPFEMYCQIPAGLALYFAIAGSDCNTVQAPPYFGATEDELAACASAHEDTLLQARVIINGVAVEDPLQYRRVTPMSILNLGPDNFYDVDPVIGQFVMDSHSFMIAPPEPGQYIIELFTLWKGDQVESQMIWTIDVVEPTVVDLEAASTGN